MRDAQNQAQDQPTDGPSVPGVYAADAVHLLRTTQQIQYQLSQMADQKASMLLGVTFVIFTIAVGQARISAPQPPLLILGAAAFVAAVLSVSAVLPSTKTPPIGGPDDNILFFGVFAQMTQEDFAERLLASLADPKTLYETFARDIYQNGQVLAGKKYRLLRYAYRVMLVGLVGSLLAFVIPYGMRLAA